MVRAKKEKKSLRESDQAPSVAKQPAPSEPAAPKETKKLKKYEIDIFRGWCKCCGICAAFCPRECIQLDDEGAPFLGDSDRCTGCGWCELHCPDFAISVQEIKAKPAREQES